MSDRGPTTRTWDTAKILLEECPKRLPEAVLAAGPLLMSEAVLHAADRLTRSVDRLAQVLADLADKPGVRTDGDTPV